MNPTYQQFRPFRHSQIRPIRNFALYPQRFQNLPKTCPKTPPTKFQISKLPPASTESSYGCNTAVQLIVRTLRTMHPRWADPYRNYQSSRLGGSALPVSPVGLVSRIRVNSTQRFCLLDSKRIHQSHQHASMIPSNSLSCPLLPPFPRIWAQTRVLAKQALNLQPGS